MRWEKAPDVAKEIRNIIKKLKLAYINPVKIICFRSYGSVSAARARIWSFPKVWQLALNLPPCYVIEVLSQRFDRLPFAEQQKILIHELLHVPKNFSGSLLPHRRRKWIIDSRRVELLFQELKK